ncbi:hypothetical protein K9L97_05870 [Candidatus Woesearchaeota archaeon]|nr:hypothetical protein [Candidatus Woesearchaeota archaeon]
MKIDVVNVNGDPKELLFKIMGVLVIILGLVLTFDFLIQFVKFILGIIFIAAGIFLFNYHKYKFRIFRF